jgi:AraC-like DNA-binding protein
MAVPDERTTSSALIRLLVDAGRRRGLSERTFKAEFGYSLAEFEKLSRVRSELAVRVWHGVSHLTGDPDLGLQAAEEAPVGAFGIFEDLIQSSATFAAGMKRFARYFSMFDGATTLRIEHRGNRVHLLHFHKGVRAGHDLFVSAVCVRGRQYSEGQIRPLYVVNAHPRPKLLNEYERVVGAPVYFDGRRTEIVFDRDVFELALPRARPEVADLLESFVQRSIGNSPLESTARSSLPEAVGFVEEASLAVRFCLEQGRLQLAEVAAVMGTSPRSLQRHLNRKKLTLRALVEAHRARLAIAYANQSKASMARRLGYSERRSFRRAQASWKVSQDLQSDEAL